MNKLALIASSGGHLYELYTLKNFWATKDRIWISFPAADAIYLLADEKKYWAYYPTNRNLKNLFKNIYLAYKILKNERPYAIISTGAGVAVPFIFIGKILGIKTLYLESITRYYDLSLSAKLIYPFADKILVQWPELAEKYKRTTFVGKIL